MKGLELSKLYYQELCSPLLASRFPDLVPRIAAGLVGEGSECLGFDDELSRDHDWGVAVCLWLGERDYAESGEALQQTLLQLPRQFRGYPAKVETTWPVGRTGVLEIGRFYYKFLGQSTVPESLLDWLSIPEIFLATATNGAVFADPSGEFTSIREQLLAFYPEDVRRKKLAAKCVKISQAGQYNFPRCAARKEYVAAAMAEAAFIDAVCSAVFLLNKRYKPFYKWMHRALPSLPLLGREVSNALTALASTTGEPTQACREKIRIIETTSDLLGRELVRQGLSDASGDFLLEHGRSIQNTIHDATLRDIDVLLG